ncbi:hypothetical protein O59_001320 [Cellvibrio sp. BR]|jgi:hypothetical protein|nr:hypothetical protein O59_001320 [Cellvibrio sp. BR]
MQNPATPVFNFPICFSAAAARHNNPVRWLAVSLACMMAP